MPIRHTYRCSSRPRIKQPQLPIPTRRRHQVPDKIKTEALNRVRVARQTHFWVFRRTQIEQFDSMIARRPRNHVFRRRVEQHLSDTARRRANAKNGVKVVWGPFVGAPAFEDTRVNLPEEDLPVVTCGSDERVIVRGPVGVEDGCGVASGEREDVRKLGREMVSCEG